ncbi:MAG: hypothetical protein ACFFDP_11300 [Promethearchaeota archaeon]
MMKTQHDIDEDDDHELRAITEHCLRFKWLADGCSTWDDVIESIKDFITHIQELKQLKAEILDNNSDYLFYRIPSQYGAYATYLGKKGKHYQFQLANGETVTYPIDPEEDNLAHQKIGTRIVLLLNTAKEVLSFMVPFTQPSPQEEA